MLLNDDRNVMLKKLKIKKVQQKTIRRTEENKTNQRIEVVKETKIFSSFLFKCIFGALGTIKISPLFPLN